MDYLLGTAEDRYYEGYGYYAAQAQARRPPPPPLRMRRTVPYYPQEECSYYPSPEVQPPLPPPAPPTVPMCHHISFVRPKPKATPGIRRLRNPAPAFVQEKPIEVVDLTEMPPLTPQRQPPQLVNRFEEARQRCQPRHEPEFSKLQIIISYSTDLLIIVLQILQLSPSLMRRVAVRRVNSNRSKQRRSQWVNGVPFNNFRQYRAS